MSDLTKIMFIIDRKLDDIADLAMDGLYAAGADHKQWYLEQIVAELGIQLPEGGHEKGTPS